MSGAKGASGKHVATNPTTLKSPYPQPIHRLGHHYSGLVEGFFDPPDSFAAHFDEAVFRLVEPAVAAQHHVRIAQRMNNRHRGRIVEDAGPEPSVSSATC